MRFSRALGQRRAGRILEGLLESGRIPAALLFHGLEGVGKTIIAHDFAKTLLCGSKPEAASSCGLCADCQAIDKKLHPDVKAVNAHYQASLLEEEPSKQRSLRVKTIRHLRHDMEMHSLLGRWKVAVVEDAHTLEPEAANALLKILEEPPPQTLWILVSPQRERMIKTILSRCFSVPFSPLPEPAVAEILAAQGLAAERARELARLAEGSVSRALELEGAGDVPRSLVDGPLSPLAAADALPRELPLARARAELALYALAQDLRLRHLDGELAFSAAERPLREIARMRQALRANADPRLTLTLAALEAQRVLGATAQ